LIVVSLAGRRSRSELQTQLRDSGTTSIDWKRPQIFESDAEHWWSDWRVWMLGLLALDITMYIWLM
jgi:hypothetical protein